MDSATTFFNKSSWRARESAMEQIPPPPPPPPPQEEEGDHPPPQEEEGDDPPPQDEEGEGEEPRRKRRRPITRSPEPEARPATPSPTFQWNTIRHGITKGELDCNSMLNAHMCLKYVVMFATNLFLFCIFQSSLWCVKKTTWQTQQRDVRSVFPGHGNLPFTKRLYTKRRNMSVASVT